MALIDDLVSWWELDEASGNAIDAHGSNDLTETSGTIGTAASGIGDFRDLEVGDTEYFTIASNSSLQAGGSFSVTAWIKPESLVNGAIAAKHDGATASGTEWLLYMNSSGNVIMTMVHANGVSTTDSQINTAGALSPGTLYFVHAYYDASAQKSGGSVNDGTVNENNATGGINVQACNFSIGAIHHATSPLFYFDGLIGKVGFWKRKLSDAEVTELYNAGAGLSYSDFGGGGGEEGFIPAWARNSNSIIMAGRAA